MIKELDELERKRRENLDPTATPAISKEAEEALFEAFPSIRQLAKDMEVAMQADDYDPDDWRVFSWAYRYMAPWYPSRLLQAVMAAAIFWSSRTLMLTIRARFTTLQIATAIVTFDAFATAILAVALPLALTTYLMSRHRGNVRFDGLTRTLVMSSLSALPLLPITAVLSTGNTVIALLCGIFVRAGMMAMAMWYWLDLRREVFISSAPVAKLVRLWRRAVTLVVITGGSLFRIGCLTQKTPFVAIMLANAERMRLYLGKRFPIACSLCNDPRGLFLLTSLVLAAVVCHMMYLVIFGMDFGKTNEHRKLKSWLSSVFISKGIYQPNVHPDELLGRISAANKSISYTASRAMLLRHTDSVFEVDSGFLSTEAVMPIFSYLDKEDEILEKEGATQWMKPSEELVPISEKLSAEKRAKDGLKSWAQPLEKEEASLSFAEYFQTVSDDEYQYDGDSDSWIFNSAELGGPQPDDGGPSPINATASGSPETEIATGEILGEAIAHVEDWTVMPEVPVDDATIEKFVSSPEFEPFIERYLKEFQETYDKDDDGDDSSPIFA